MIEVLLSAAWSGARRTFGYVVGLEARGWIQTPEADVFVDGFNGLLIGQEISAEVHEQRSEALDTAGNQLKVGLLGLELFQQRVREECQQLLRLVKHVLGEIFRETAQHLQRPGLDGLRGLAAREVFEVYFRHFAHSEFLRIERLHAQFNHVQYRGKGRDFSAIGQLATKRAQTRFLMMETRQ